jgi:uncharacterized hydrophobic protein (TIGR00341 family)
MSLRLIEVFLPESCSADVEALLTQQVDIEAWYEPLSQNRLWVRLLVNTLDAEAVVDQFTHRFEGVEGFRLLLLEVEASLPYRSSIEDTSLKSVLPSKQDAELDPRSARLNRAEIYDRVAQSAELSWVQIAMVLLSTTIAAIGILRDNQAVVIGAMVIAPLLKPNMALAVATTLGDRSFALRTLQTGLIGIVLALMLAVAIGYAVPVALDSAEIVSRLQVSWPDGILAFASGMAGAIALTTEERSSLVGVMVSVALLPPLVVLGLLLGSGYWAGALGAGLLVMTNLICLNLAAVTTFLVQDIRPASWEDLLKAEQVTWAAYGVWIVLLLGLVGIFLIARMYQFQAY